MPTAYLVSSCLDDLISALIPIRAIRRPNASVKLPTVPPTLSSRPTLSVSPSCTLLTDIQPQQYNTALSILFIGYVLGQVPSNMILSKVRPSWYLSGCMVIWGIISGCAGAVNGFGGLVAVRFLLGFAEAPFFVGCAFLFSGWYKRNELGFRLGSFTKHSV